MRDMVTYEGWGGHVLKVLGVGLGRFWEVRLGVRAVLDGFKELLEVHNLLNTFIML